MPQVKSQSPRAVLHNLHSAPAPCMAAVQCTHGDVAAVCTGQHAGCSAGAGGEGREVLTHLPLRQVAMSVANNLVSHSGVGKFRVSKRPELADITMTLHSMHDQGIEDRFPGNADISLFATYTRPDMGHNGFPIHRICGPVSPGYSGRGFNLYTG